MIFFTRQGISKRIVCPYDSVGIVMKQNNHFENFVLREMVNEVTGQEYVEVFCFNEVKKEDING